MKPPLHLPSPELRRQASAVLSSPLSLVPPWAWQNILSSWLLVTSPSLRLLVGHWLRVSTHHPDALRTPAPSRGSERRKLSSIGAPQPHFIEDTEVPGGTH